MLKVREKRIPAIRFPCTSGEPSKTIYKYLGISFHHDGEHISQCGTRAGSYSLTSHRVLQALTPARLRLHMWVQMLLGTRSEWLCSGPQQ